MKIQCINCYTFCCKNCAELHIHKKDIDDNIKTNRNNKKRNIKRRNKIKLRILMRVMLGKKGCVIFGIG